MAIQQFNYGSDESGLVWGFLMGRDERARAVGAGEAKAWLTAPAPNQFLWLHFNLSNAASERWMRAHAKLSDEYFATLHQGSSSTRLEVADNCLIAVVNDVLHNFSLDNADISTLWVQVTPQLVISARRKPLESIERLRQDVLNGAPLHTPVELLVHLLRDQADILVHIVRDAVSRVDRIEDRLLTGRLTRKREELGNLRRVLVRLRRLLAPEPAAVFRLLQRPPLWIRAEDREELRQATEEFAVVLSDLTSLQERIKLLQEEIAARVNEDNNRSLFLLTIVTVMALPINIVAGLMGMNVGGVPLGQHPHGFWIVLGLIGAFSLLVAVVLLRLQRQR
ncbi:magnesium transporter CorA [Massilia sp. KIM]|uniref:transporter n=1 Tax=Massilia sp. KIM TaxID=1955422 RepID=UPI0009900DDE|nr:transporter [Massilia sp. KIM]OON63071.1 magnesium transporter CorA [Massilia sp. KIM]